MFLALLSLFACSSSSNTPSDPTPNPDRESLRITPGSVRLDVGKSLHLVAERVAADGSMRAAGDAVEWTSADTTIAEVTARADGSATLTGVAEGKTTLAARLDSLRATVAVEVAAGAEPTVELVALEISPATLTLPVGVTRKLVATGLFSDDHKEDLTASVAWSSSDPAIATVDDEQGATRGQLTTLAAGTTHIVARDGNLTATLELEVTGASLVSIEVTPSNPSLVAGTTQQLTATGVYDDSSTQDLTTTVTWSSSAPAIASVSDEPATRGLAKGLVEGSSVITATAGGVSGSTTLSVGAAQLESIEISPANPSIAAGTTQQLTATGVFSDSSVQDITASVVWASATPSVASVSDQAATRGLAKGLLEGSSVITATSGEVVASVTLTVGAAQLVSIAVTPQAPSITGGATQQLTATGTYTDASTQDITATVIWSSADVAVATVDNAAGRAGLVSAVGAGSSVISASVGAVSGSTELTVLAIQLVSITVTPANPSIAAGTTQQLVATGSYDDGSTQDITAQVTWSSADPAIVAVDNAAGHHGLATGLAEGASLVTATSGDVSGSTDFTVTAAELVRIEVTPAEPEVAAGNVRQLTATGVYTDASTQNLTASVAWSSATPAVATVSNVAGRRGEVSALTRGTSVITATLGELSGNTTFTVSACNVTLNEVAVAGPRGANDEYVELYNGCGFDITVGGWRLVYRSATGNSDTALATLASGLVLAPGDFRLYVGSDYPAASPATPRDGVLASALAAAGGGIGLRDAGGVLRDSVGYGTANNLFVEGQAVAAPASGKSASRFPADGTDTNNNNADFHIVDRTPRAPNL